MEEDATHEGLPLVAERGRWLEAIQELLTIDRDWTGVVDDDKTLPEIIVMSRPRRQPC